MITLGIISFWTCSKVRLILTSTPSRFDNYFGLYSNILLLIETHFLCKGMRQIDQLIYLILIREDVAKEQSSDADIEDDM